MSTTDAFNNKFINNVTLDLGTTNVIFSLFNQRTKLWSLAGGHYGDHAPLQP